MSSTLARTMQRGHQYVRVRSLVCPHRHYINRLLKGAATTLTNGIMADDDYLVNGVPDSKFNFRASHHSHSLQTLLANDSHIEPFTVINQDLSLLTGNIMSIIGSDHAVLNQIAKYFFKVSGKRVRPAIILLLCRALNRGLIHSDGSGSDGVNGLDGVSSIDVSDYSSGDRDALLDTITPVQHRISEIAELIHTASLLHDDVIDDSNTRRGVPSINSAYGNKFAILGGDFLLARASVALARLRHPTVIELMSTIIEHLVKGEILQLKAQQQQTINGHSSGNDSDIDSRLRYYMTKNFYKTASLLANSARSAAILGGHSAQLQDIAFEYGKHLGLAFQIIDDVLDFEGDDSVMGKPKSWDLSHGIVTAPVIFAMQAQPQLIAMIDSATKNKCSNDSAEMTEILRLIQSSNGIDRARALAEECAENAAAALLQLKPSVPRSALTQMIRHVLERKK